jgi:hypothetical protein
LLGWLLLVVVVVMSDEEELAPKKWSSPGQIFNY